MSSEQQNTREAIEIKAVCDYRRSIQYDPDFYGKEQGYIQGFRGGAASVDHVETVRRAFKDVRNRIGGKAPYGKDRWGEGVSTVVQEMDAVLAEYEEKQK